MRSSASGFVGPGVSPVAQKAIMRSETKPGVGENIHHLHEALGAVTGFFSKFAACGGERTFAGLHAPGDNLEKVIADGVAILADQDDAAVAQNRQEDDGTGVGDDIASGFDVSRLNDDILTHAENFACVEDSAGKQLGVRLGHDSLRVGARHHSRKGCD